MKTPETVKDLRRDIVIAGLLSLVLGGCGEAGRSQRPISNSPEHSPKNFNLRAVLAKPELKLHKVPSNTRRRITLAPPVSESNQLAASQPLSPAPKPSAHIARARYAKVKSCVNQVESNSSLIPIPSSQISTARHLGVKVCKLPAMGSELTFREIPTEVSHSHTRKYTPAEAHLLAGLEQCVKAITPGEQSLYPIEPAEVHQALVDGIKVCRLGQQAMRDMG